MCWVQPYSYVCHFFASSPTPSSSFTPDASTLLRFLSICCPTRFICPSCYTVLPRCNYCRVSGCCAPFYFFSCLLFLCCHAPTPVPRHITISRFCTALHVLSSFVRPRLKNRGSAKVVTRTYWQQVTGSTPHQDNCTILPTYHNQQNANKTTDA